MSDLSTDVGLDLVGRLAWDPVSVEVRESDLRRFMEAIGDDREEWDPRSGALVAPLLFLPPYHHGGTIGEDGRRRRPGEIDLPAGDRGRLLAGCRVEFFEPILAGDLVTATTRIAEVTAETGRSGDRVRIVTETRYEKDGGEVSRTERWTVIRL